MAPVFRVTATSIPSVLSAKEDSNSALSVSHRNSECSASLKASVSVWMDTMPMLTTHAFLVGLAVECALLPTTALPVLPFQLPTTMAPVPVPKRPTLLSHPTESATALLVDPTVLNALMRTPALPAKTHTPKLLITNASVLLVTLSILTVAVSPALQVVTSAHLLLSVRAVLTLSSYREALARSAAMMATLRSVQSVRAAQLAVRDVLRTSSVTTVLTVTITTKANATLTVPQAPSEIAQEATGNATPATLLAKPASTTPLSVQAVSTEWAIYKPLQLHSPVFFLVLMALTLMVEFVKSVISGVLLVSVQPQTVFLALQVKFSTEEAVGLTVPPFLSRELARTLPAPTFAPTDSTSDQ